eukprot:SAG31_NODE_1584_length_7827_cov_2.129788_1_plen_133_part_00
MYHTRPHPQDCSLNGKCDRRDGLCVCYAPWSTAAADPVGCGRLDTLPGPKQGIYGSYPKLGVASWGGNAIRHDSSYHLFVSEVMPIYTPIYPNNIPISLQFFGRFRLVSDSAIWGAKPLDLPREKGQNWGRA